MPNPDAILEAVYRALDEVNQQVPPDQQLAKSPETVLLGEGGRLDSLGLISLLVAAEQEVEDAFGATVSLTDALLSHNGAAPGSDADHPLQTIATLVRHISALLGARAHV